MELYAAIRTFLSLYPLAFISKVQYISAITTSHLKTFYIITVVLTILSFIICTPQPPCVGAQRSSYSYSQIDYLTLVSAYK